MAERAKALVHQATTCSAMVNFAPKTSEHQGITPLADSVVYQSLLGAKYARAAAEAGKDGPRVHISDLSFAILDELVPAERLEQMTFPDVVKYRKESANAREAFLELLASVDARQRGITDGDYAGALRRIVNSEFVPEARKFKNKMAEIYDRMFGNLATKAITYIGGTGAAMHIFGGLSSGSLLQLAGLAGAAGAAFGQVAIEAKVSERSSASAQFRTFWDWTSNPSRCWQAFINRPHDLFRPSHGVRNRAQLTVSDRSMWRLMFWAVLS